MIPIVLFSTCPHAPTNPCAQEALKLIVKQYVPLNNTFLFDGIYAKASVFEL
jgi:hypothetical protein